MFNRFLVYLKNFDWILFGAILFLVSFGLLAIYSASLGQETKSLLNLEKQVIFVSLGIVILFILSFMDYHVWRNYSGLIFIFGIILLVAVLVFGEVVRGTRGWFALGIIKLQPVEFVKFFLILFLAQYFAKFSLKVKTAKHIFLSGLSAFVFLALVMLQPDFGSAMILFVIWVVLVYAAGLPRKYFLALALILTVIFSLAWGFYFKPYQKERIMTFANPSFNPLKQSYNVAQAIIAVGAGGSFGRGIGFGSQSQLKFLPESQNDFIFAVVGEQFGFLGVCLLIFFFGLFFWRCLASLKKINNDFGIFFIIGVVALIFIEMFINIGMNIGLLPVVGISLPFLSYGGSAMIANLTKVGVVESIIVRSRIR